MFDLAKMEEHLANCYTCRAELSSFGKLDLSLSMLPDETVPPDFAAGVTGRINKSVPETRNQHKRRLPAKLYFYRDLAIAAAATLVICFSGGSFFDYQDFNMAARKMNTAVQICMKTSGEVVNQAYDTAGNISPQLFIKGVESE